MWPIPYEALRAYVWSHGGQYPTNQDKVDVHSVFCITFCIFLYCRVQGTGYRVQGTEFVYIPRCVTQTWVFGPWEGLQIDGWIGKGSLRFFASFCVFLHRPNLMVHSAIGIHCVEEAMQYYY